MATNHARECALRALMHVLIHRRSLDDALDAAFLEHEARASAGAGTDPRDASLARELSYGVLRWLDQLQAMSEHLLRKPLLNRDRDVSIILLLGLYQLTHLRIHGHAAVSATVELVRFRNKAWAVNLINACLRRFVREKDRLCEQARTSVALRYAHPDWLVERLKKDWPVDADQILAGNQSRAPMTVRVNRRQSSRESYLIELRVKGIDARLCEFAEYGVELKFPTSARDLPGFTAGLVSVQDQAAQLAVQLLSPVQGRVLDACAAPGGKSAHLLELNSEVAHLTCVDSSTERLADLRANLTRLGLCAEVREGDATAPDSWWDGRPFDAILVDAPCSATGVIRRHPDIKFHRRARDLEPLQDTQHRILRSLWPLLVPGGRLMYATCSVLAAENDAVVRKFIATQPDAKAQPLDLDCGRKTHFGRQVLPGMHGMDGFYYALLLKSRD